MKKYFVAGLLLAALVVLPSVASAQSMPYADLLAKIEVLKQMITTLQSQQNQDTSWCHTFEQNLGVGMTVTGSEVTTLQKALTKSGFTVTDSGFYDENTAASVSGFQLKYKNEILTTLGVAYPTGYFGPVTRRKMNSLYGCGNQPPIVTNYSPVINSLSTYSGPVGTVVDIKGSSLAGFENDRNVWIESSNGTRGILYGDNSVSTSNMVRVTLNSPLCQTDNSYSGRPCNSWLNLTPGSYKFQVITPSGNSNKFNFEITGNSGNLRPTISDVSGPRTLRVGEAGIWTIHASDPENGALTYAVIWSDGTPVGMQIGEGSGIPYPEYFTLTSTVTHTYNQAGNFYPQFFVKDNGNGYDGEGVSVNVGM